MEQKGLKELAKEEEAQRLKEAADRFAPQVEMDRYRVTSDTKAMQ